MPSEVSQAAGARLSVPPLACDCHMHVFGAPDRYPSATVRSYTPQEASLTSWRKVAQVIGLERVVVVQPSAYGTDNRCLVEALRDIGPPGRGIAQIDSSTSDSALQSLHAAGVRGVRLNPKSAGMRDARALRSTLTGTAHRIRPLGWHVEIYADVAMVGEIADTIRDAPVPVVLDHMGGVRAGETQATLRPLLDLLANGHCWVKLSGADRVSRGAINFADAVPIARAIIKANPDQVVWGTDWPHTAAHGGTPRADAPAIAFRSVDYAALLNCLAAAAVDEPTLVRILAANPARLYGF
jgi:predicted TIM-barrel fold metal-dependent hydrolase